MSNSLHLLKRHVADADDVPDALTLFFAAVGRHPMLSAAQEYTLALCIEDGVTAAAELLQVRYSENDRRRLDLERKVAAAADARMTMVASNLRLVVDVAKRFRHSSVPLLDLIQEGTIGLIRAVDKFDWRIGARFGTMARWWIRHYIAAIATQRSSNVHSTEHMDRRRRDVLGVRVTLEQALGRTATPLELATASGLTMHQLAEVERAALTEVSLDVPPCGDATTPVWQHLVEPVAVYGSPEDQVLATERTEAIAVAMASLAPRTREILAWRYGYIDGQQHSFADLARRFQTSRESIRKEARAGEAVLRQELTGSLGAMMSW